MCSLWQAVKNAMHKAFWDILESELNDDPPVYGQAIRLLEEIREVTLPSLFRFHHLVSCSCVITKCFLG